MIALHAHVRRAPGMTLIEVVIVLLVAGIVAMLGVPLLDSALTEARLLGAMSEIVAALEFAQLTAASTGRSCRVTVDPATNGLWVEQIQYAADFMGSDTELAEADVEAASYAAIEHPVDRGSVYQVFFGGGTRFSGVGITASAFDPGNAVVFDALGAPSKGGSLTVTCVNQAAVVTVDASSGKVTES